MSAWQMSTGTHPRRKLPKKLRFLQQTFKFVAYVSTPSPIWVKFHMTAWIHGVLYHAKFHPKQYILSPYGAKKQFSPKTTLAASLHTRLTNRRQTWHATVHSRLRWRDKFHPNRFILLPSGGRKTQIYHLSYHCMVTWCRIDKVKHRCTNMHLPSQQCQKR